MSPIFTITIIYHFDKKVNKNPPKRFLFESSIKITIFSGGIIMPEFTYEIVKTFGVISEGAGGWAKELNLISWNGKEPKYDIRDWGPDHEKMGKGVTLTAADAKALKELLAEIDF